MSSTPEVTPSTPASASPSLDFQVEPLGRDEFSPPPEERASTPEAQPPATPGQEPPATPEGQPPAQEGAGEEETAAFDDNLPPAIPPKGQDYRPELYERYAKRFNIDPTTLNENPALKAILKSKLDSDVYIASLQAQRREPPPDEEPKETPEAPQAPVQITPEIMAQVYEQAGNAVKNFVTPLGANLYVEKTNAAWAAYGQAVESGDKAKIADAQRTIAETQMQFLMMAMADILPRVVPNMTRQQMESLGESEAQTESTYHAAREEMLKDPEYADLKGYFGDNGPLEQLLNEQPWILDLQFTDDRGKRVDAKTNAMAQYNYAVDILRGRGARNPDRLVAEATRAGQEAARRAREKQDLGKGLGGARPSGTFQPRPTSDDEWFDRIKKAGGSSEPMENLEQALRANRSR